MNVKYNISLKNNTITVADNNNKEYKNNSAWLN